MVFRKPIFTLALLLTLMLSTVQAQEGQAPAQDVRVVVDISGSMKLNDPDNLRRPAVRLIARLLPDGTGVGLWTFGRMVNMLVPHDSLGDELRASLISGSESINSIAQRTNIGGAIEESSDDWYSPDGSLANTHLILLSDGKVDISPSQAANERERERILEDLVPALAGRGLTIHTIALSGEADLDLLGAIADLTGGVARVADSAEELSRIFADTVGQAVPANEVPLENNAFTVDEGVEEFTALIFSATPADQRELTLVTPDGERHGAGTDSENLRWAREAGYDLITAEQPVAGEWQVEGTLGEGSRVTVVSDLRLEVEPMPSRFQLGEKVDLRAFFTEEGERITDPDFLGVITVSLSMTTEDGRRGSRVLSADQPPADGIYQDTIAQLPEPGQYLLELEADGATFSRKFRKTLVLESPEGTAGVTDTGGTPLQSQTSEVAATPEPQPEAQPEPDGPVDLSQLEEPDPQVKPEAPEPELQPEPEAEPEPESGEPSLIDRLLGWWPWALGVLGILIVSIVGLLVLKRRRSGQDEPAASSDESSSESSGDTSEAPVTAEEEEPVVTAEVASESVADEDESALPELDELTEQEIPEDGQSEASPEAEAALEPDETTDGGEEPSTDPLAETPDDLPEPDTVASEDEDALPDDDDDDEEFGLEDFDLSDIDDLPDLESDEAEEEREKPSRDDDRNKE